MANWQCMMCGELIVEDDPWFHKADCQRRKRMEQEGKMPPRRETSPPAATEQPMFKQDDDGKIVPVQSDTEAGVPLEVPQDPDQAPPATLAGDSPFPSDWRERNLRRRLPDERKAVTHHFRIHASKVEYDGYLTVGFYPDGDVGEVFLKLHNQGSTVSGFCDAWSIAMSMLLQRGAYLEDLCRKYMGMRFDPSGRTDTPGIRVALSPVDYAARYLLRRYVEKKPLADDPPSEG